MRILDPEQDRALDKIYIYLTPDEARELRDFLKHLVEHYDRPGEHIHVSDSEYQHELAVSIYKESSLDKYFTERERKLILEDR